MASIAFRVDASPTVGSGHVARCRALATQLRHRGRHCHFVASATAGPWAAGLEADGHRVDVLPAGVEGWEADAAATARALGAPQPGTWLVVDHYRLDARWHRQLRGAGWRILAIDDLADRPLAVDALLDPAPTAVEARYRALLNGPAELLLGPRHCLLRQEFAALHDEAVAVAPAPGRVHLALGGTDRGGELARVAGLVLEADPGVTVVAVSPVDSRELAPLRAHFGRRLELQVSPPNVARTMLTCQAALGAPGGMLWERFCLGLPSACFAVSSNQQQVLADLAAAGWLLDLGTIADFGPASAARFAAWLRANADRAADRVRLRDAVDGLGAPRVADWLVARDA